MRVDIRLEPGCTEPRLVLITGAVTPELDTLIRSLRTGRPNMLVGFRDGAAELIQPERILRVYAANQRVYCVADTGEYTLRLRLYEAEERLDKQAFLRISHSEIVNLRQVRRFDLSLTGTVCVVLRDGSRAYASRRYVSKIKDALGI